MHSRVCISCKLELPIENFGRDKRGPSGMSSRCKACNNARAKKFRDENPERIKEANLKRYYGGMTYARYMEIYEAQGGVCAICGNKCKSGRLLAVDHDHACCPQKGACGKCTRGLLCSGCNQALGHFNDDLELMTKAMEYVSNYRIRRSGSQSKTSERE